MIFKMTMERTERVGLEFEADNEEMGRAKAEEIFEDAIGHPEKFRGGNVEHDYALCDEEDKDIIQWK